ncbi:MAG: CDP-diacylglycerol--serine O-phosphatidyltransferase [Coxiellaceae bacterium]|nr:CDP-diacylglycerol--serine O-phosphatidyltransferase [Coxiellaceae bacterium]
MATEEENDIQSKSRLSRSIFLLPNLLTTAALFCGFYSIVAAMKGYFDLSAISLFFAMAFDFLDGRVARLTHTSSEFGAQYDSLSDMVCFGLAPALLLYQWSLQALGKPGWLAAFFYTACTALRLARFNIQEPDKHYFYGLSTPAAAAVVASFVWMCYGHEVIGTHYAYLVALFTIVLALLKASSVPYRSFKDIDLKGKVPFIVIFIALLVLVLISFNPPHVLFVLFAGYALYGPVLYGWQLIFRRGKKVKTSKDKDK